MQAVERTGMRAQVWEEGSEQVEKEGVRERRSRTVLTSSSGLALLAGFAAHAWTAGSLGCGCGLGGRPGSLAAPEPSYLGLAVGAAGRRDRRPTAGPL